MSDFYTEQLVKRQKASSTTHDQSNGLIIFTVLSGRTYIYDPIRNNWSGDHDRTGSFFCSGVWMLNMSTLFVNGSLDIDKIMAKSHRKNMFVHGDDGS